MKRIISPILETYYVAACRLTLLQQAEMPGVITVRNLVISFDSRNSTVVVDLLLAARFSLLTSHLCIDLSETRVQYSAYVAETYTRQ